MRGSAELLDQQGTVGGTGAAHFSGPPPHRGKCVVIWKNEDGAWKLHRDIWTSSVPMG
ncbi:MAG: hypothetical protein LJF04_14560 [Gemmatimonadetes bacterium]|nr:hypothetical protein [Gemmatimonadota bacterium]